MIWIDTDADGLNSILHELNYDRHITDSMPVTVRVTVYRIGSQGVFRVGLTRKQANQLDRQSLQTRFAPSR